MKTNVVNKTEHQKMKMAILKDARKIISTNKAIIPRAVSCFVRLRPRTTYYDHREFDRWANSQRKQQFNTSVLKNSQRTVCQVCALGALLLADIDRNNHATVKDLLPNTENSLNSREKIHTRLANYFSHQDMDLIEACFEQWTDEYAERTLKMYAATVHIEDDSERLIAILDFLIKHNGEVC